MPSKKSEKKSRNISRTKEVIDPYLEDIRYKLKEISLGISIMGKGFPKKECWNSSLERCLKCEESEECEAKKRKKIKDAIEEESLGDVTFMEEIEFIYPGMEEEIIIEEFDLIFLFPESPGSICEFKDFSKRGDIPSKLRIFVKERYHPLMSEKSGVLRDSILEFLTEYGHVYSFESIEQAINKILKLITSYRVVKYKKEKKK